MCNIFVEFVCLFTVLCTELHNAYAHCAYSFTAWRSFTALRYRGDNCTAVGHGQRELRTHSTQLNCKISNCVHQSIHCLNLVQTRTTYERSIVHLRDMRLVTLIFLLQNVDTGRPLSLRSKYIKFIHDSIIILFVFSFDRSMVVKTY